MRLCFVLSCTLIIKVYGYYHEYSNETPRISDAPSVQQNQRHPVHVIDGRKTPFHSSSAHHSLDPRRVKRRHNRNLSKDGSLRSISNAIVQAIMRNTALGKDHTRSGQQHTKNSDNSPDVSRGYRFKVLLPSQKISHSRDGTDPRFQSDNGDQDDDSEGEAQVQPQLFDISALGDGSVHFFQKSLHQDSSLKETSSHNVKVDDNNVETDAGDCQNSSSSGNLGSEKQWEKDLRLPKDVIPVHYELYLYPDLESESFSGRIFMHVEVKQQRSFIVCHIKGLNVTKSELFKGCYELVVRFYKFTKPQVDSLNL